MDTMQNTHSPARIHRGLAWSMILITVTGVIALGLYVGNKFFWDKYKNLTKEEYAYRVALKQVKDNPNDITARINLGWALLELNQYEKAAKEFERALQLDPRNETAKYDIAVLLTREGKMAEAEAKFEEIINANPKFVKARHDLALVKMNLGKYDDALKQYDYVIVSRPGNADVIYQMGIAYEKKGEKSKAKEYYAKALEYDPKFSEAKEALAKLN